MRSLFIFLFVALSQCAFGQWCAATNLLQNGDFENALDGWSYTNGVRAYTDWPLEGLQSVRLEMLEDSVYIEQSVDFENSTFNSVFELGFRRLDLDFNYNPSQADVDSMRCIIQFIEVDSLSGTTTFLSQRVYTYQRNNGLFSTSNTITFVVPSQANRLRVRFQLLNRSMHLDEICLRNQGFVTTTAAAGAALFFYPNPASSTLHFATQKPVSSEALTCRIYSSVGILCYQENIHTHESLDVQHLPSGLYYIEVHNQEGKRLLFDKLLLQAASE